VRLKWHTLAVAGSLGIFGSFHPLLADDNPANAWQSPASPSQTNPAQTDPSPRLAARRSAAAPSPEVRGDNERLAHELLRQAMVELDAKHFDVARRLTRRAAALGAAADSTGVRPDQLLLEIDQRQRSGQVVVPATTRDMRPQFKARAVEFLDRGILALDEKRYDDAEQCARQASQLHVAWDKFDYKPDNLLDDVRRERAGASGSPAAHSVADGTLDARSATPAEWSQRTNVAAPVAAPQQPLQTAASPTGGRTTAQAILEQAMDDLRAGRDEVARLRIEQALNSVPATAQSSPVASFGGYAAPSNRPMGLTPGGLVPTAPGLTPPAVSSTFFPVRRDQPNVVPVAPSVADVALKPMHDPFLGDDATTTDKLSPGAQAMREAMPTAAPINPVYLSRTPTPASSYPVQRVGYDSPAPAAAKLQTSPDAPTLNPQLGWLEKMSSPLPPQGMPPAQSYAGQQTAPQQPYGGQPYPAVPQPRGYNVVPLAQPAPGNPQWQPAPTGTPSSGGGSAVASSPDQPKPGFFEKMWNAVSGQ
jgi:hypothetical protein